MSISFMIVAIGAMALSIAAATYHAYAARHQLPVSRPYDGPGSPMSLAGSGMVFTIMAMTGLGRGPLALVLVIGMGFSEVIGFTCFTLGAQYNIAVTSVLASQFAPIAAVMAYVLFRERLGRLQIAGVAILVVAVTALSLVS